MPIIHNPDYKPPFFAKNPHFQTIAPTLFRKVPGVCYRRERIETPDGDFIDLDIRPGGGKKVAILLHGLEGHSRRSYMKGMVRALNRRNWDAVSYNLRGCSEEINRCCRLYHAGDTADLDLVVRRVSEKYPFFPLALVGFSIGGNVLLRYLGEKGRNIYPFVKCAAAVSVPCQLNESAKKMGEPSNRLYFKRFMKMFHKKIREKKRQFPDRFDDAGFEEIKNFEQFDNRYTAPLHGFKNEHDYRRKSMCKPVLPDISVPALLLSARDDPFLTQTCFPETEARNNPYFFLQTPEKGGHVGFIQYNRQGEYWHEKKICAFFGAVLEKTIDIRDEPSKKT